MNVSLELFGRVREHARAAPDRIAYVEVASGRSISYAQLVRQVESNVPDHSADVAILQCANRIEFPVQYLATLLGGGTVFPISAELTDRERSSLSDRVCASGADIAASMLLTSSGTTGIPKIVRRDAGSLDAV
jgi:acyl-CoA synthetase (AMP-forming)/AMP-acid ligase II